jgi:hypothetical protein
VKRTILFAALLTVSAFANAFTMTKEHCELLEVETFATVVHKENGMSLYDSQRNLVETYSHVVNNEKYLEMMPYTLAIKTEYYSEDSLSEIDYVEAITRNCIRSIGQSAK